MILCVAVLDTVSTSALSMSHEIRSLQVCQHYEWPNRIPSQEPANSSTLNQMCVWKMVCERWRVTKLGVKDAVWKMACDKVGCDKVVCDRWCVTKLCVTDGVWQSCVWQIVCDKVVCVTNGVWQSCVWQMVCDKVVCDKVVCDKMVCDK